MRRANPRGPNNDLLSRTSNGFISGVVMINWKSLYIVLGVTLGGVGTLLLSAEFVMLGVAFMGSAAVQVWLDHRSLTAHRGPAKHDRLFAGKP